MLVNRPLVCRSRKQLVLGTVPGSRMKSGYRCFSACFLPFSLADPISTRQTQDELAISLSDRSISAITLKTTNCSYTKLYVMRDGHAEILAPAF